MGAPRSEDVLLNTASSRSHREALPKPATAAYAFHRSMPAYRPTPLREAPGIAGELGVAQVWVKDESDRFGLPSFKILGATWGACTAIYAWAGETRPPNVEWSDLASLAEGRQATLVAATDGNHGRAVARVASWLGLAARVYVPAGTARARIAAIQEEGASVLVVDGSYEYAVMRSARDAEDAGIVLVSDTSWPGYEAVPSAVIDGYSTLFGEIEEQLAPVAPSVVAVQMGVGALAAGAVRSLGARPGARPVIVGVEPASAACVLASLRAGALTTVPGPHPSAMVGLNCDTPSLVAWPTLSAGLEAAVAIDDEHAIEAVALLAREGIVSGESGAAGLAGLLALGQSGVAESVGLDSDARVLLLSTEGDTASPA